MAIIPHTSLKNLSDRIAEILSGMEAGTNNHEELIIILISGNKQKIISDIENPNLDINIWIKDQDSFDFNTMREYETDIDGCKYKLINKRLLLNEGLEFDCLSKLRSMLLLALLIIALEKVFFIMSTCFCNSFFINGLILYL